MKKIIITFAAVAMFATSATAQGNITLNSRAWSTNYWTTILYNVAQGFTVGMLGSHSHADSLAIATLLPGADLVFPVGMAKEGFTDYTNIYGPYHRAFATPFKKMGDFCVGIDASWTPTFVGLYAGVFFKSQELVFKTNDQNLRSFYFQPRGGLVITFEDLSIEGGVFYDKVVGCSGNLNDEAWGNFIATPDKGMLSDGLGLDFGVSYNTSAHSKTVLMFSMPLHNFFNEGYECRDALGNPFKPWEGYNRRVGYITLTHRIRL
jgi:hypothetical protein